MQIFSSGLFEGKTGEDALCMLLSFVIDEKKAKAVAKSLIDKLGSYSAVLDAPESELVRVEGMTEKSAKLIKAVLESASCYMEDKNSSMKRIYDSNSAYEAIKPKFVGAKREIVTLLLLDGRGRIIYNGIVNEGSVSEVPIYIRRVVELCLMYDAYMAIIAHNHPSGNPAPSRNDINSTRDIEFALNGIDVVLEDHIIIADEDYTSLKSSEWLGAIKQEVADYKKEIKSQSEEQEEALFS